MAPCKVATPPSILAYCPSESRLNKAWALWERSWVWMKICADWFSFPNCKVTMHWIRQCHHNHQPSIIFWVRWAQERQVSGSSRHQLGKWLSDHARVLQLQRKFRYEHGYTDLKTYNEVLKLSNDGAFRHIFGINSWYSHIVIISSYRCCFTGK